MKRLKVRWSTALNGQIAVNKWRTGGFHLVLMDIQMPIMSGLEATKEIRRLERVNGIGVFSTAAPEPYTGENGEEQDEAQKEREDDRLVSDGGLFKSPVIIVALTASSLQSDRHEALAAGCNDFLTKVSFMTLSGRRTYTDMLTTLHSPLTSYGLNVRSRNGAACKLLSTLTAGASGKTLMPIRRQKRRRLSAFHEPAQKDLLDHLALEQRRKHQHKTMGTRRTTPHRIPPLTTKHPFS